MTIFVTPRATALRAQLDTVIFDMDGVLIDISNSIRRVNCLAPAFYLRELLGWKCTDDLLSSGDIELYKHAGGFNDDWDLTYVIVLSYLVKSRLFACEDANLLTGLGRSHEELSGRIAADCGGLAAAEAILMSDAAACSAADFETLLRDYNQPLIRRVFQEIVAGDLCERMYHFPTELYAGRGLIYEDRRILDHARVPQGKKIGLLTGRTYEEADIGRELCGLERTLPDEVCVTKRDGFHKPDPGGLALLAARLGTVSVGIYIGDTLDDLRTVRSLNALGTVPPFICALVLSGPAGAANESLFREAGADLIGIDVNEVLEWINKSA